MRDRTSPEFSAIPGLQRTTLGSRAFARARGQACPQAAHLRGPGDGALPLAAVAARPGHEGTENRLTTLVGWASAAPCRHDQRPLVQERRDLLPLRRHLYGCQR